jgi:hypothetical protein
MFEIEVRDGYFSCVAPGYGVIGGENGDYGNGSLFVNRLSDLDLDAAAYAAVITELRRKEWVKLEKLETQAAAVREKMKALV